MMMKKGLRLMAKYRVIRNKKSYLRRRRFRRFLTLTIIGATFLYTAHMIYENRMDQLDAMKEELAHYQERYNETMLRQGFYENQIVRLEDEEYVAMLARGYLRSLPDEIVFRLIGSDAQLVTDEDNEN